MIPVTNKILRALHKCGAFFLLLFYMWMVIFLKEKWILLQFRDSWKSKFLFSVS